MTFTNLQAKEYQKRRYKCRMSYALKTLGGCCISCGKSKKLELDHIDPNTKNKNISSMYNLSLIRFNEELLKCQILCRTCHLQKTAKENTKKLVHGTMNAYKQRACRCPECRRVNREYKRMWRLGKTLMPFSP